jgi:anion-transporting  ArsA/GET3 family ATPase
VSPRVYVCFGTGGVGKTTVSAALGCALAQRGVRTLVITCDPARRLAEAFGVLAAPEPVRVDAHGMLWCFMPEAAESARQTVALLFGNDPTRLAALQQNHVFGVLVDGLSGVHELGALAQLAAHSGDYDAVVVDTAPTRHALELLRLPGRVGKLVDSRALRWLASVSRRRLAAPDKPERSSLSRLFDWGESRLLTELDASLGGASVAECMQLLAAGMQARPELSQICQRACELLSGAQTSYVLVAAPRDGADADIAFFHDELSALAPRPTWLVLNRTVDALPEWADRLSMHPYAAASLRSAARLAARELGVQARQTRETRAALIARFPRLGHVSVPKLDAAQPSAVVHAAAAAFDSLL